MLKVSATFLRGLRKIKLGGKDNEYTTALIVNRNNHHNTVARKVCLVKERDILGGDTYALIKTAGYSGLL